MRALTWIQKLLCVANVTRVVAGDIKSPPIALQDADYTVLHAA